ncbi:MAG: 3-hydroxyacyl-CoA dehydrogenase NAD-binding domain-containing protein [Gammaproteobacteria bacterium]
MSQTHNQNLRNAVDAARNWRLDTDDDGIAWLCVDKEGSSTNVLSKAVVLEFATIVRALAEAPPKGLVLYSGKDSGFILGADINEFPDIATAAEAYELISQGHAILEEFESLPCTTVAMIDGMALGGGLELALACDCRVAAAQDRSTLGLPEVQLGLHPGFGGTVRAVRLLGVTEAMSMMLTGRPVRPAKALKMGLVDKVVDASQLRKAAGKLAAGSAPRRSPKLLDRILGLGPVRPLLSRKILGTVASRARREHYPAPYAIVDLWEKHGAVGAAAYDAEARSFSELVESDTSRNLVRVYFLQERMKHTASSKPADDAKGHVHVVGAGVMGGDIAAWCALKGYRVTLQDRELKYVEPALARAAKLFEKKVRDPAALAQTRDALTADVAGDGVSDADVIIEAIFENRDAKQALYRDLEPRMKSGAVLATNTSSIPLEELAPALTDPSRLIGLHFFNPVAKLPLVEVVRAAESSEAALDRGLVFTRSIDKLPLPCKSHPGFLVNRILAPYMAEALDLVREGVAPVEVDKAATDFGMPMGPIELIDSVGVDVALHVATILSPIVGREVAPELAELVKAGKLGQKTGQGFYTYRDRKPVRPPSSMTSADPEITDRLMLAFVNEAAACLADEVVTDPDLIDGGVIFGTGFAPFRGGPLHYARERGIDSVIEDLERLAGRFGPRFRPSRGWAELRQ